MYTSDLHTEVAGTCMGAELGAADFIAGLGGSAARSSANSMRRVAPAEPRPGSVPADNSNVLCFGPYSMIARATVAYRVD